MILNTQPTNATIRNTGSVYSSGGIALNASVALNAYVALGGRDIKFGQKPDSGSISPSGVAGSESLLSPGTMANVAVGGSHFSWVNPDNAKTSSDVYVTSSSNMTPIYDKIVSLILADGSHGTENKKTGLEWVDTADTYFSYGSAIDVWGETLTAENINDSDFGVVLQIDQNGSSYSDYLEATNFGFSVPTGSTIDGILVEIERNYVVAGRSKTPQVDHIRITVYYTDSGSSLTPLTKNGLINTLKGIKGSILTTKPLSGIITNDNPTA